MIKNTIQYILAKLFPYNPKVKLSFLAPDHYTKFEEMSGAQICRCFNK